MTRKERVLQHIKSGYKTTSTIIPTIGDMRINEERYIFTNGVMYLYYKSQYGLFRKELDKVA